jgi:hypothetical protein
MKPPPALTMRRDDFRDFAVLSSFPACSAFRRRSPQPLRASRVAKLKGGGHDAARPAPLHHAVPVQGKTLGANDLVLNADKGEHCAQVWP